MKPDSLSHSSETTSSKRPALRRQPPNFRMVLVLLLAAVMAMIFVVPVVALLWRALGLVGQGEVLDWWAIVTALIISLGTTLVSMGIIAILGTSLAWVLARYDFPLKRVLTVIVEMPIVMPPVVAGLALLTAFGRRGIIGAGLSEYGVAVTFTPAAVILAQVFVAAPFYIRAAQARFGVTPRELEEAAGIDGADGWRIFSHIILPLSSTALASGLVLSWARALGEFGATILFAGNLRGRTQTMPLMVYSSFEQNLSASFMVAVILLALAALALGTTRWLAQLDKKGSDPLSER